MMNVRAATMTTTMLNPMPSRLESAEMNVGVLPKIEKMNDPR
jgi:hypothetical protein